MERFYGTVHDSIELRSTFSGDFMNDRMALLRHNIETVRKKWVDVESYGELMEVVRSNHKLENLPEEVSGLLLRLLQGYRDYADVDLCRPQKMIPEHYTTLELYCSEKGHGYLFKVTGEALRKENASEDVLLAATILLEFLTIDLYNLRLSQIGDSRYSNFQGVVYRGMSVTSSMIEEYKHIFAQPDLRKRSFAVPLSLFSASTDANVMKTISKSFRNRSRVQMHWEIHVHGLDPVLLEAYQAQFPSSIVTSICAMPIARVSPFAEKEILLRGAYFHLIQMHEKTVDEQKVIHLTMVMINANRDHTTEEASHIDEKKYQREAFARIISASKFEACAKIATEYSKTDGKEYQRLYREKLDEIQQIDNIQVPSSLQSVDTKSSNIAVWVGGSLFQSYPKHYVDQRRRWQESLQQTDWETLETLLAMDYEWSLNDWLNVGNISGQCNDRKSVNID
ncbi:MAG: hypothetical protein M1822_007063 [Bathelium mastoideum]|nr:MAG: hypothetical protein M1822_007063 [Bathelium mastoideum]